MCPPDHAEILKFNPRPDFVLRCGGEVDGFAAAAGQMGLGRKGQARPVTVARQVGEDHVLHAARMRPANDLGQDLRGGVIRKVSARAGDPPNQILRPAA